MKEYYRPSLNEEKRKWKIEHEPKIHAFQVWPPEQAREGSEVAQLESLLRLLILARILSIDFGGEIETPQDTSDRQIVMS